MTKNKTGGGIGSNQYQARGVSRARVTPPFVPHVHTSAFHIKSRGRCSMQRLRSDYSWGEVFNQIEETRDVDKAGQLIGHYTINDVAQVVALDDGYPEGLAWVGVFQMKDGRFLMLDGSTPYYTGWEIGGSAEAKVASDINDLMVWGLSDDQRDRLGVVLADHIQVIRTLGQK